MFLVSLLQVYEHLFISNRKIFIGGIILQKFYHSIHRKFYIISNNVWISSPKNNTYLANIKGIIFSLQHQIEEVDIGKVPATCVIRSLLLFSKT